MSFALNDFMLATLQVELAAISSSKGKSLDPASFGWALSTTCNGIWAPRCCFTACACRHDARCHSLPAEWYRFAWCMSLSFASASAVFNFHMNKLQQVPEQFCNACLQPYGHDPADCKNKEGRWCTILSVRSTIPHHKRFSVNCHKMFCFVAPSTPYVYWWSLSSLGLVAKSSLEFWISLTCSISRCTIRCGPTIMASGFGLAAFQALTQNMWSSSIKLLELPHKKRHLRRGVDFSELIRLVNAVALALASLGVGNCVLLDLNWKLNTWQILNDLKVCSFWFLFWVAAYECSWWVIPVSSGTWRSAAGASAGCSRTENEAGL